MSLEDISKKFLSFGLDEDEAKVLPNLYLLGNARVSLIAKSASISRVQAYRALKKLQDKNLVETSLNRPVRFSAVPVEKALEILLALESNRLRSMKETKEQILSEISKFKVNETVVIEPKYKVIEGRAQVYSILSSLVNSAKSEIIFFMAKEDLMRNYYSGVFDALDEAHDRGVKILGLIEIDHTSMDMVESYCKFADCRHTKIPGISIFFVIDDSDLLLSAMTNGMEALGLDANVALWTNATNFNTGIKRLLKESWNNSQDAETRIQALKTGKTTFEEVLVLRDAKSIDDFIVNMMSNAKSEISFVSVPYDKDFDRALQKVISRCKEEGVKLRVLTSIESGVLEQIKHLSGFADVRHIELQTRITALMVDVKEVLLLPSAGNQRFLHGIWSNVGEFVGFFTGMFDMLWSNSAELSKRMSLLQRELDLQELKASLEARFKKMGFNTKYTLKGSSGVNQRFFLVAIHPSTKRTVVIDLDQSSSKEEAEIPAFNFAAKCFDVKAEHRLLITALDGDQIRELSAVYGNQITIISKNDVEQSMHSLEVEIFNA